MKSRKSTSDTCPLGARWVEWDFRSPIAFSSGEYFAPGEYRDLDRAQREAAMCKWKHGAPDYCEWSVGAGDSTRLTATSGVLGHRVHRHASMVMNKRLIHIDWARAEARAGTPGRFRFHLIRIYVDGALAADAVSGALLGFARWGQPALAVISPRLAIGVDSNVSRTSLPPRIWRMVPDLENNGDDEVDCLTDEDKAWFDSLPVIEDYEDGQFGITTATFVLPEAPESTSPKPVRRREPPSSKPAKPKKSKPKA